MIYRNSHLPKPLRHARQVKEKRPACGAQGGAILRFALSMESQWKALRHHSLAFSWASAERSPPLLEFTLNLTRMPLRDSIIPSICLVRFWFFRPKRAESCSAVAAESVARSWRMRETWSGRRSGHAGDEEFDEVRGRHVPESSNTAMPGKPDFPVAWSGIWRILAA